ncbi:MAG: Hemoglobin-like protein HbO [Fluviibacter phosphoraccumulans EoVTN8]
MVVPRIDQSYYELLGGEEGVRTLVDDFYDHMQLDERFAGIKGMHPQDMSTSRDKLFWFLSGWLGGPPLFEEKFGHPRLLACHLPFSIGESERDQWMTCMVDVMQKSALSQEARTALIGSLFKTADWMRNKDV